MWWRRPDHYYWLTALLAARGAQRWTCRTIAGATLAFAAIDIAMTASPAGPAGRQVYLQLAVGILVALMSGLWFRHRWPTQTESSAFVVVCSFAIAAPCLLATSALAGMLGCTAFAVLAGYVAFFHHGRLMLFNTVIALATTVVLAVRVSMGGDTILAVCGVLTVGAVYALVPFGCHALVHLLDIDMPNSEIDPLTGLLNREAFLRATGELISVRGRFDDRYFVMVLVALDNFGLLLQTSGPVAGDRARVAIAQALRETTRGGAIVAHTGDAEYLIADSFPSTDATPLIERVRGSVATTPPRLTASIGVVCSPMRALADAPPDDVLNELIDLAHSAMIEARRAGGNQARYIVCSSPGAFEDNGSTDVDDLA